MLRDFRRLTATGMLCAVLAVPGLASAALIDRGNGLIYDTDLDITWMQDANYAQTSGYDTDGAMSWSSAAAWADQLVYGGFSDWRLPTTIDIGLLGCNNTMPGDECAIIPDPSTSEMAHLFYTELGNLSGYFENGNPRPGGGLTQTGPFINMQVNGYWGGTYHINSTTNTAYGFDMVYGVNYVNELRNARYALAVSDGDIGAVPVPAAGWLAGAAFAAAAARARRRKA
jgi:Protein of unknown function (DUF1566)